jgi:hypothetical protein
MHKLAEPRLPIFAAFARKAHGSWQTWNALQPHMATIVLPALAEAYLLSEEKKKIKN